MEAAEALCEARRIAGITQQQLARRSRHHAATIAAYERGDLVPSSLGMARLLRVLGAELEVAGPPREPTEEDHRISGEMLIDVLSVADAMPASHAGELRFPRLPRVA